MCLRTGIYSAALEIMVHTDFTVFLANLRTYWFPNLPAKVLPRTLALGTPDRASNFPFNGL